jgi:1-acyl-sn-glycerol-3-phosphate acyltransferase
VLDIARLWSRVALLAAGLLALLPLYWAGRICGGPLAAQTTRLWHRLAVRVLGIRIHVTGSAVAARPLLLLANHVSWLDIPVIASLLPVSFVAKREVAAWPVFGWLARLQRSVFVDRDRPGTAVAQAQAVAARLSSGDAVVLFPEGTSGDGLGVLPFRSALVGAAQRALAGTGSATVQPVAIVYTRLHGLPLGRLHRPRIAWYGDMALLPHLTRILAEGAIDVHVVFGPARPVTGGDERKSLSAEAERLIGRTVAEVNAGREPSAVASAVLPARAAH